MLGVNGDFTLVHEIHADKGVNLEIIYEGDGVSKSSICDLDREGVSSGRAKCETICPAETGLRGDLRGMGERP